MSISEVINALHKEDTEKKLQAPAKVQDMAVLRLRDAALDFEALLPKSPDVSFAVHLNLVSESLAPEGSRQFKIEVQFTVTFRGAIDWKALSRMFFLAERLGFHEHRVSSLPDNKAVLQLVGHFNQVDAYRREPTPESKDFSWAGKLLEISRQKKGGEFEVTLKAASQDELDRMVQDAAKASKAAKRKKK